jgi:hypothetical protein
MFLKFEHYDLAISEVSHYEFLRGHSSISQLKDHMLDSRKESKKYKMNSLLSEGVFWGNFELEIIKELLGLNGFHVNARPFIEL